MTFKTVSSVYTSLRIRLRLNPYYVPPTGLEDYTHLVRNLAERTPSIIFLSPAFPSSVQIAISATALLNPNVSHDGLDTVRIIVGHDSLNPQQSPFNEADKLSARDKQHLPAYAAAIRQVFSENGIGQQLVQTLLTRLVTDFHEDNAPLCITVARLLAQSFRDEMAIWIPIAVQGLPPRSIKDTERDAFLANCSKALQANTPNGVRMAWVQLHRACLKSRERSSLTSSVRV